jgi:hypothetical protein
MGLFKDNILIDIIGIYNGGSSNFAKDKTLRRKSGISKPNTAFDLDNEWDILPKDNADGFGNHNTILNIQNFDFLNITLFPNPVKNKLQITNSKNHIIQNISIYNLLGNKMVTLKKSKKEINVSFLSKGIYILQFEIENKLYSTKFIKK